MAHYVWFIYITYTQGFRLQIYSYMYFKLQLFYCIPAYVHVLRQRCSAIHKMITEWPWRHRSPHIACLHNETGSDSEKREQTEPRINVKNT